jgi:hypothetical protein
MLPILRMDRADLKPQPSMRAILEENFGRFRSINRAFGGFALFLQAIFLALVAILWLSAPRPVSAHPVPDGVVFRGVQVVVWSQRIEIRYQLGLSDSMIQDQLRELLAAGTEIPDEPGQALRMYGDVMFPRLPEKISVTIDRRPQELSRRRADIIRQHHIQIELVYRIEFTVPAEPVYFLLIDDNFQGIPGYHLAGIRSRGLVQIPEANAVPVLSRLSRDPQTEEELRILSTPVRRIEAMIATIGEQQPAEVPREAITPQATTPALSEPVVDPGGPAVPPPCRTGSTRRWIWPATGCLLMLVAVVWMIFLARRS